MINWIVLILAGLFEVAWVIGLKLSNGFTKPIESAITIIFASFSLYLLAVASREIPVSISYIVWVGIGAAGIFLCNVMFFESKVTILQTVFFIVILIGIIGLKISSTDQA
ncbi:MAG: multidrug efflux SMR transporter [Pseudomonadota bacterium]